jgi:hypothetical protein
MTIWSKTTRIGKKTGNVWQRRIERKIGGRLKLYVHLGVEKSKEAKEAEIKRERTRNEAREIMTMEMMDLLGRMGEGSSR